MLLTDTDTINQIHNINTERKGLRLFAYKACTPESVSKTTFCVAFKVIIA